MWLISDITEETFPGGVVCTTFLVKSSDGTYPLKTIGYLNCSKGNLSKYRKGSLVDLSSFSYDLDYANIKNISSSTVISLPSKGVQMSVSNTEEIIKSLYELSTCVQNKFTYLSYPENRVSRLEFFLSQESINRTLTVRSVEPGGKVGDVLLNIPCKKIKFNRSEEDKLAWAVKLGKVGDYFKWEFVDYNVCKLFNYIETNAVEGRDLSSFDMVYIDSKSDRSSEHVDFEITAIKTDNFIGGVSCISYQLEELGVTAGARCHKYLHAVEGNRYKEQDLVNLKAMEYELVNQPYPLYASHVYIKRLSGETEKVLYGDKRISCLKVVFASVVNYLKRGTTFDGSEDRLRLLVSVEDEKVFLFAQKVGACEYNTYCYKKDFGFIRNVHNRSDKELDQVLKSINQNVLMSSDSIKVIFEYLFNTFVKDNKGNYNPLIWECVKIGDLSFINYVLCG